MMAVAIIGVIAAIALPTYTDYVETARQTVMVDNMATIRLFEEEARMATGSYKAGTYDPADPDAAGGLKTVIGWDPRTSDETITYVVDNVTTTGYRVTATHSAGTVVVKNYTKP